MGLILGIVGRNCSGKDSVAEYLMKKKFHHISLSDILREELRNENKEITRENLIKKGQQFRKKYGPCGLASKAITKINNINNKTNYEINLNNNKNHNYIISSIRNPYEVDELRKHNGFLLLFVDSDSKIRFQRMKQRATENDPNTIKEFMKFEQIEEKNNDPTKQSIADVIKKTDLTLNNNFDNIEQLHNEIDTLIKPLLNNKTIIKKRNTNLTWDDYFMAIAVLSAQRSKDPSTQVGACIVNEKNHIVGTGYNGFPTGCPDDELPWCNNAEKTNDNKYPYVVHAEANAIINSTQKLYGARIYVVMFPCNECAKLIIQSGIKEICYINDKYKDTDSVKASKIMLNMAGVKYRKLIPNTKQLEINFDNYINQKPIVKKIISKKNVNKNKK